MNKRQEEYDFIKGILIMGVLMGHYNFLQWPMDIQSWGWTINEVIYLFHMPLFFAAGVLFCKEFSIENMRKDALRILFPFFIYLWRPDFLFNPIESMHQIKKIIPQFLYGNHPHGVGILWYLPTIFLLKTWFSLFKKWEGHSQIKTNGRLYFWGFLSILSISLGPDLNEPSFFAKTPWGFFTSIYLFCLSYGIYKVDQWEDGKKSIWIPFIIAIIFGYLSMIWPPYRGVHRVDLAQFIVPNKLNQIIVWLIFLASLFLFLRNLGKKNAIYFYPIKIFGYFSFPIFLYHEMFLGYFDRMWVVKDIQPSWLYLVIAFIVVCASMVACVLLSELLVMLLPSLSWIGLCSHPSLRKWIQNQIQRSKSKI